MLRWALVALIVVVWISAATFGLYILAYYAGAAVDGDLKKWNDVLPGLYEARTPAATWGLGIHFAAGGLILAFGCIQLLRTVRSRAPRLHRWIGRVYVIASLLAGVGGLTYIVVHGTIGGAVMDFGLGLYGELMIVVAVQTFRHAWARRLDIHRVWAIRLFALVIGAWLYRMDYGFWFLLADGAGHTRTFDGPFDWVMGFFFYIPNLAVAQAFIAAPKTLRPSVKYIAATALTVATLFLCLGSYYFIKFYWGPAIIARTGW